MIVILWQTIHGTEYARHHGNGDGHPRERRPVIQTLSVVLALALGGAAARVPDALTWPDAAAATPASHRLNVGPPLPPGTSCPSDRIQEQRAAAAAALRHQREAVDAAARTVHEASLIARSWLEERQQRWVMEAARRSVARLRDAIERHVANPLVFSRRLCQVLSDRDAVGCAALGGEAVDCQRFLALANAGEAARCEDLPEVVRGTCGLMRGGTCPPGDELCGQAGGAIEQAAGLCAVGGPEPSWCMWAVLARLLRDGRAACDLVAPGPGRSTLTHQRLHALCLAVASRAPERCPQNLYARVGAPAVVRPLGRTVEATVVGGLPRPRMLAVVHTDTPAVCHLRAVALERGTPCAEPAPVVVSVPSWETRLVVWEFPATVDPAGARTRVELDCVPTVGWAGER